MLRSLPILKINGIKYYVDERLRQLRQVDNPHNYITVSENELYYIIGEAKDGNEDYEIISLGGYSE